MTNEYLEIQLAKWKRLWLVNIGASCTLLATAVSDIPNQHNMESPGWYGIWLILQLAALIPAVILLSGGEWRKLPFSERLHTIFGYLAVAWLVLAAFGIKTTFSLGSWPIIWNFLCLFGIALGLGYWFLYRKYISASESTFL